MKTTVYELLGMIKDGKAPKKIKYNKNGFVDFYKGELYERLRNEDNFLNGEVEILEEPKGIPEKLDHLIGYDIQQFDDLKEYVEIATNDLFGKVNKIIDTLNQVLDYLESKGD